MKQEFYPAPVLQSCNIKGKEDLSRQRRGKNAYLITG
jgi:hypothetical protein